jgi:hypothetical protein
MTRRAPSLLVTVSLSTVLLAACGGSGGGETTPASYLFFSSDGTLAGVRAVDPASPGSPLVLDGAANPVAPQLLTVGKWGGTSGKLSRLHTHAMVYSRDAGSGTAQYFRLAGTPSSTPPAPVQIADASALGTPCSFLVYPDYSAPDSSLLEVRTGDCGDPDLSIVPLSAGADRALVPGPRKGRIQAPVRSASSGAIVRLLMIGGGKLYAEAPDLAEAEEQLLVDSSDVSPVVEWAGKTWLRVGAALAYYDAATRALVEPAGGVAFAPGTVFASDETRLYFVAPEASATLYSIELDGSGAPTPLLTLAADEQASQLRASRGRVIYQRGGGTAWCSVPKAGGGSTVLFDGGDQGAPYLAIAGARLYFTTGDMPTRAASMKEDGSDRTDLGDSTYSAAWGFTGAGEAPIGSYQQRPAGHLFLSEAGADGWTLTGYDGASGEALGVVGTLPGSYFPTEPLLEGSGGATLLVATRGLVTATVGINPTTTDLFFADASRAGSLVTIDDGDGDHWFIGTSGCSAGGPGGLAAGLLAAVGLWLLRRPALTRPGSAPRRP